jgi:hypothetical protein
VSIANDAPSTLVGVAELEAKGSGRGGARSDEPCGADLRYRQFGHAELAIPRFDASVTFFTDVYGLTLVGEEPIGSAVAV